MTALKHTPYADASQTFKIGLQPMLPGEWIELDAELPRYLAEKNRLLAEMPDRVFLAEGNSEKAQTEVRDLLVDYLLQYFPNIYRRTGSAIEILGTDHLVDLDDLSQPPLLQAALLVQEDLVIMHKSEAGWRLFAACVCFPSSWSLVEKFGKVMHEIHDPVPGFEEGTRNAGMIERIFDNLPIEQPVERFNWSVYNDDALFHESRGAEHFVDNPANHDAYYLRVERQTLKKLPKSGDVLFTIRIHIDPFEVLRQREDKVALAAAFIESLQTMRPEQLDYKGIFDGRERLIEMIEREAMVQ